MFQTLAERLNMKNGNYRAAPAYGNLAASPHIMVGYLIQQTDIQLTDLR